MVSLPITSRSYQISLTFLLDVVQNNTDALVAAALKDKRLSRSEVLLELAYVAQSAKTALASLLAASRASPTTERHSVLDLYTKRTRSSVLPVITARLLHNLNIS